MISRLIELNSVVKFIRNGLSIKQTEGAGGLPISRIETISSGVIDVNKVGYADVSIGDCQNYMLESGDILFSHINSKKHIGKAAIYNKNHGKLVHGMNLLCIRPDTDFVVPNYLYYYITSSNFKLQLQKFIKPAVNQASITTKDLGSIFIKIPSIDKQMEIITVLDKVKDISNTREHVLNLADDLLRATFLDMFGDQENNPKKFPVGTIRDLVSSANYGTSVKASESSGIFPILRMGNITYQGDWNFTDLKYIDLDEKSKERFLVRKGDLLFNRTNSKELVGKTAVFESDTEMAFAGYLVRIRPNELGNNYYISGYLNSSHGKNTLVNMSKSIVGMANINAQEMQNIKILIPPKKSQDRYEGIYKAVKNRVTAHIESKNELEKLFNTLSNQFFK